MPFVIDASITASWAFRDPGRPAADLAADLSLDRLRRDQPIAPSFWWFEVRNILVVNERRKRLTETDSAAFLRDLSHLAVILDNTPDQAEVLRLARTHKLSVYDAAYLELALRYGVGLASLDSALIRAAGIEALPFIWGNH